MVAASPDDRAFPPRVSVVLPAWNAAPLIGLAIASVAGQTLSDVEVIVVDDASTDDTAERAIAALSASGLGHAVIRLERNSGPAAARNAGVARARGYYVAFLDADDEWLPGKLEAQVRLMDDHPEVTLCGCQGVWVREDGEEAGPVFENLPRLQRDGWKQELWAAGLATPCAMARREDLGDWPFDPRLAVGEDRDLWIRLASKGSVGLVQEPLVRIRLSSGSYMARHAELAREFTLPMIERHLAAFADRLTLRERLRARGHAHSTIGKAFTERPETFAEGAKHLLRAAACGFRPADSLRQILCTAPVMREVRVALKAWLRR